MGNSIQREPRLPPPLPPSTVENGFEIPPLFFLFIVHRLHGNRGGGHGSWAPARHPAPRRLQAPGLRPPRRRARPAWTRLDLPAPAPLQRPRLGSVLSDRESRPAAVGRGPTRSGRDRRTWTRQGTRLCLPRSPRLRHTRGCAREHVPAAGPGACVARGARCAWARPRGSTDVDLGVHASRDRPV